MELFIETVRNYPCLWNITSKDYRNIDKKEIAWKSIVEDLKMDEIKDIKTAKSEWKKLRDNHRDSLKRTKTTSSGQAATNTNTWKYAELMEFLQPYMKNRIRSTNLTDQSAPPSVQENVSDDVSEITNDRNTQVNENEEGETETRTFQSENEENRPETTNDRAKRRADTDIIELLTEMEQNYKKRQETRDLRRETQSTKEKHSIDLFFESMAITIKAMPTYMQCRIKRKIFNIVSDAEEELENYGFLTPETLRYYRSEDNTDSRFQPEPRWTEGSGTERPHGYNSAAAGSSGYARYGYHTTEDTEKTL